MILQHFLMFMLHHTKERYKIKRIYKSLPAKSLFLILKYIFSEHIDIQKRSFLYKLSLTSYIELARFSSKQFTFST